MKAGVLAGLIAVLLSGFVGFAIGRRSSPTRDSVSPDTNPTPPPPAPEPDRKPVHEQPESAGAAPQESPSKVGSDSASEKPVSAKDRLFSLLLPHFSEEKKHSALWSAVVGNAEMQRKVFDLLMASDDRDFLEAGQDLLISIRDQGLLKDVISAFGAENHPDRRAMLAYALGGNLDSPDVKPYIDSILGGGDLRLMKQALVRMNVQGQHLAARTEYVPQLRHLVTSGPTTEIRAGAARALRGDRSEEGIRFLIDRMLNDESSDVQYQAMVALPITYSSGGYDVETQVRPLLTIAFDEKRPDKMRRWAAERALMGAMHKKNLITDEQKAALTELSKRKN